MGFLGLSGWFGVVDRRGGQRTGGVPQLRGRVVVGECLLGTRQEDAGLAEGPVTQRAADRVGGREASSRSANS